MTRIHVTGPQFDRPPGRPAPGDPPTRWSDLYKMSESELRGLGLRVWSEIISGTALWLLPAEWYDRIPDGTWLVSINGEPHQFKRCVTDADKRFGMLAYGIARTIEERTMKVEDQQVIQVKARRLAPTATLPTRATGGASGFDLHAHIPAEVWILGGCRALIPTGIQIAVPPGFEGQIRPRSGRAYKDGLTVLNAPGTLDSDYRGEVMVLLVNTNAPGSAAVFVQPGDRIAQLVIQAVPPVEMVEVDDLDETGRGDGGFGSTGT